MTSDHRVHIEHWQHPRLPADHHLSGRWSIMFRGRAILTFSSAAEAIEAARVNRWTVEHTPVALGGAS